MLLEGEFDADSLLSDVRELLGSEERLNGMSSAMRALAVTEATDKICGTILDLVKK